jgi:hypothetical protein
VTYTKKFKLLGYEVTYERRTRDEWMGRFGGGWNWKFGVQVGGKCAIFSLIICTVRISKC